MSSDNWIGGKFSFETHAEGCVLAPPAHAQLVQLRLIARVTHMSQISTQSRESIACSTTWKVCRSPPLRTQTRELLKCKLHKAQQFRWRWQSVSRTSRQTSSWTTNTNIYSVCVFLRGRQLFRGGIDPRSYLPRIWPSPSWKEACWCGGTSASWTPGCFSSAKRRKPAKFVDISFEWWKCTLLVTQLFPPDQVVSVSNTTSTFLLATQKSV